MGRLETERKSERGREKERENDRQRGKWATEGFCLLSRRQARGRQCDSAPIQTAYPPTPAWPAESDWVLAPHLHLQNGGTLSPWAQQAAPPPVQPRWAEGLKLQHSLGTPQAEKKQLLWYPGPAPPRSPRHELSVCFPRSDHQKLLNLWLLCEALNRKRPSVTFPAQRMCCQRRKTVVGQDLNCWIL